MRTSESGLRRCCLTYMSMLVGFFLEIISSLYQGRCKSLDPDKGKVGRDRSIFESRYIFCSGTFILLLKLYNFF